MHDFLTQMSADKLDEDITDSTVASVVECSHFAGIVNLATFVYGSLDEGDTNFINASVECKPDVRSSDFEQIGKSVCNGLSVGLLTN